MAEFTAILQETLNAWLMKFFLLLAFLVIICIGLAIGAYVLTKKLRTENMSDWEYKKTKSKKNELIISFCMIFLLLILLPIGSMQKISHLKHDIVNQQYVCAEVDCSVRHSKSEKNYLRIEQNGENIDLHFPAGWSEDDLPRGEIHGTVWYSEESHILLRFIADFD